jgi:hypothetical protein
MMILDPAEKTEGVMMDVMMTAIMMTETDQLENVALTAMMVEATAMIVEVSETAGRTIVIDECAPMTDAIVTEIMTKRNATAEPTIRSVSGEETMKHENVATMTAKTTEASAEMMSAAMTAKTTEASAEMMMKNGSAEMMMKNGSAETADVGTGETMGAESEVGIATKDAMKSEIDTA